MRLHGAVLGCKLGRLWRRPCSKGVKPQRAHGLAIHHAIMPPHEELWTSASPLHSSLVLFHGALLGCKLGRLWRRPCSKGAKPQRAHGLAMHHAMLPPHEELRTSASPLLMCRLCSSMVLCLAASCGEVVEETLLQGCQVPQRAHSLAMH